MLLLVYEFQLSRENPFEKRLLPQNPFCGFGSNWLSLLDLSLVCALSINASSIVLLLRRFRFLHIRTVAAVLIWLVVALLILNSYFRSVWILLTAIVTVIIAVLIYFSPQLRKR